MELRVSAGKSIFLLVCWWVLLTVVGSLIISFIGVDSVARLRVSVVLQDLFLFVAPVALTMLIAAKNPLRFTRISGHITLYEALAVVGIAIVSIPVMNVIVAWNEGISFPESWGRIEEALRTSEALAQATVNRLMSGTSAGDLILSILIVGVLTGFSEELFFRGALQPLLATMMSNRHAAVWATAFIFSAVHLQFFGFVPRLLMGAYFGYLVLWSGSLRLSMLAHILNNSLVALNGWLIARGVIKESADTLGIGTSTGSIFLMLVSVVLTTVLMVTLYRKRISG